MTRPEHEHPLDDGLYVSLDPNQKIILRTPRGDSDHYVVLEPGGFLALLRFAKQVGWGKIIERASEETTRIGS